MVSIAMRASEKPLTVKASQMPRPVLCGFCKGPGKLAWPIGNLLANTRTPEAVASAAAAVRSYLPSPRAEESKWLRIGSLCTVSMNWTLE